MRLKQIKLIFYGLLIVSSSGCATVEPESGNFFMKYYGEDGLQEGVDLLVNNSDKTLILLGSSRPQDSDLRRIFLVKIDWDGNIIWTKKLGGLTDSPKDIERANDGGFVILSETVGITTNSSDVKLIKVSEDGVKVDSVVFGSPRQNNTYPNEYPVTLTAVPGGYIVTGSTEYNMAWANSGMTNNTDALHLNFDNALTVYDTSQFYLATGESENDFGIKTVRIRDGRYYLFGTSQVSYDGAINDDFNFWYFGMNNGGIQNGSKGIIGTDGPGKDERLYAVCSTFSNGFFLAGTYKEASANNNDMYIAQLYEDGGELYTSGGQRNLTIYKLSEARNITPVAVCQSYFNRRGYLILGNEGQSGARNIWLSKVDDTGNLLWSASFGSNGAKNDDSAGMVAELPDGKIVVLGTVNLNVRNLKMALFKLNGDGKLAN